MGPCALTGEQVPAWLVKSCGVPVRTQLVRAQKASPAGPPWPHTVGRMQTVLTVGTSSECVGCMVKVCRQERLLSWELAHTTWVSPCHGGVIIPDKVDGMHVT
jgi:hypothetical protein